MAVPFNKKVKIKTEEIKTDPQAFLDAFEEKAVVQGWKPEEIEAVKVEAKAACHGVMLATIIRHVKVEK